MTTVTCIVVYTLHTIVLDTAEESGSLIIIKLFYIIIMLLIYKVICLVTKYFQKVAVVSFNWI